jgi:hypothetical protein
MFLISALILGWMIYRQRDVLLSQSWSINIWNIIIAFCLFSIDLMLVAVVWSWIMDSFGTQTSHQRHIANFAVANVAKRIPGTVWYIAGRGYLYGLQGISLSIVSVASTMEFAIAVISGLIASIIFAFPQLFSIRSQQWLIVVFTSISLIFVHPRVIRWLLKKLRVESPIQYRYSSLIQWLVTYFLAWVVGGMVLFAIAGALHPLPISNLPYLIGCWSLAGTISSTFFFFPSNLGVTEISLSLLISHVMPSADAAIIAILMRLFLTGFEFFWALIGTNYLQRIGVQLKFQKGLINISKSDTK